MLTIDSQVHTFERDHPGRPWRGHLPGPDEVTGAQMVAAMDEAGVDGALLISPFLTYRFDASYAMETHAAYPERFGLIKPVDTNHPAITEIVEEWAARDGTVGVRIIMAEVPRNPDDPGLKRALAAATRAGLPVNFFCWGRLDDVEAIAARNPDTTVVVDHLGITQPLRPPVPDHPFAELPRLLKLASLENVVVKVSATPTLSREAFPYRDIWDPLARIFDAFGIGRCLWGTDWTRVTPFLTYREGVEAFRVMDRLTGEERAELMGGALQRIYRWSPKRRGR